MRSTQHMPELTGLRGIAAFWVLCFHLGAALKAWFPDARVVHIVVSKGYLGVDLFFALSGFVIAYAYAERLSVGSWNAWHTFIARRFARIYPVHVFVICVLVCAILLSQAVGRDFASGGNYSAESLLRDSHSSL